MTIKTFSILQSQYRETFVSMFRIKVTATSEKHTLEANKRFEADLALKQIGQKVSHFQAFYESPLTRGKQSPRMRYSIAVLPCSLLSFTHEPVFAATER